MVRLVERRHQIALRGTARRRRVLRRQRVAVDARFCRLLVNGRRLSELERQTEPDIGVAERIAEVWRVGRLRLVRAREARTERRRGRIDEGREGRSRVRRRRVRA